MHKSVFFTKFPKKENGYQGNQYRQQWARWYMLIFYTWVMVIHGVDKIVAVAIIKEINKTFWSKLKKIGEKSN